MKRLTIILMCVAGVVFCAGCGNGNQGKKGGKGDDGKVDVEKVADKLMKEAFEGESHSKEAAK